MTAHDDDRLMVEAVEAGASGFLSKDLPADEILQCHEGRGRGRGAHRSGHAHPPARAGRPRARRTARRDGVARRPHRPGAPDPASCSRRASATTTSPRSSTSAPRPCRPTCGTSWASSGCTRSSRPSPSPSRTAPFRSPDGRLERPQDRYRIPGIQPRAPRVEASGATPGQTSGPRPPPRRARRLKARANPSLARAFIHCLVGSVSAARRTFPPAVRGSVVTRCSARGALNRARSSRQCSRSSSSVGGSPGLAGTTQAATCSPHSGSGSPRHRDVGDLRVRREHGLHLERPDRLRTGADRLVGASGDPKMPLGADRADVAGAQPPVGSERRRGRRRIVAVAVH